MLISTAIPIPCLDIFVVWEINLKLKADGEQSIEPANAADYVDRSKDFLHKIDHDDLCYKLFMEHGFEWGGDWKHSKDYQHFEK